MGKKKSNTLEFVAKSSVIHNNKYDYSKTEYITQLIPVVIICPIHGEFLQQPKLHLKYGCNKCAQEIRVSPVRITQDGVIKRAIEIHGDRYDYSKVCFVRSHDKVEIICRKHGTFYQTMHDHLSGKGCSKCVRKVSKMETRWLDSLGILSEYRYYKISVGDRFYYVDGFDPNTQTIYEFNGDYYHGHPIKFDPNCYNQKTQCTFGELYNRTLIKESKLKAAGFNVITMWEHDYGTR